MANIQSLTGLQQTIHRQVRLRAMTVLRWTVGVVYIWFGALKLFNVTPVGQLVKDAVPLPTPSWFVPALGALEIVMGLWFLTGRHLQRLLPLFVVHMLGTFSVLVFLPAQAFQHYRPWELSMTGEFVVKNIVLLTAGLISCVQPRGALPGTAATTALTAQTATGAEQRGEKVGAGTRG
ncbi:DoxX family membrane protein [Kitasatospora sp. NPDC002227]|uniref:DoxX family membrane protein n=1 Tax=Kitasatospora sp. NPDC002227 TaxID=3154773 RepID=UPI00331F73BD